MTPIIENCPCCGRRFTFKKPTVSLDFNSISYGRATVMLAPILAEMAHVLVEAMPRIARREFITGRVWGGRADVEDKRISIDVHIVRLRRALRPLGLSIETVRSVGWRVKTP